jgi:hypothetical protein
MEYFILTVVMIIIVGVYLDRRDRKKREQEIRNIRKAYAEIALWRSEL